MADFTLDLVLRIRGMAHFVLRVAMFYHQFFSFELFVAFAANVHFLADFVDLFHDFLPLVVVLQMNSQVVSIREIGRTLFARV